MKNLWPIFLALSCVPTLARAAVDPKCEGLEKPVDYNEQVQQDFLQNYFALATSYSAVHGPLPHKAGRGAVLLGLSVLPPLGCGKRFVLGWTKTEETNKMPVMPRPVLSFALPVQGPVVPYGSFSYLPPVTVGGTRNVFFGVEVGVGWALHEHFELGLRGHATSLRTIADVATAFDETDPVVLDFYNATTFGADLLVGLRFGDVAPYASLGLMDVSSFFLVGDDNVVVDNRHPYAGLTWASGVDALVGERLRVGVELFGAPGGVHQVDPAGITLSPSHRYGNLITGRLRLGVEFGSEEKQPPPI
ncbi:MAG: hypothetical protein KC912_21245 [Proteobacteria bacterium]|nr:hypothetical protein [Pseudomonadota bacterium]